MLTANRVRQSFVEDKTRLFSAAHQQTCDGGNEKDACRKSRRRKTSTASSRWLSADTPLTHRHPLPLAPLGGSPQGTGTLPGLRTHRACARKPTCSHFQTSVSFHCSGHPSPGRAGNGAGVNSVAEGSPAGSHRHLRSPSNQSGVRASVSPGWAPQCGGHPLRVGGAADCPLPNHGGVCHRAGCPLFLHTWGSFI